MPLASLFRRTRRRTAVMAAYHRIVERSRHPVFFADWGVPDTLDGRFETLALHAFLVLNRLKASRPEAGGEAGEPARSAFAQELFDTMFADLDRSMREMGATDIGVGRHVKAMAKGFYGRIRAYDQGLSDGESALAEALRRNLYGTTAPSPPQIAAIDRYLRRQVAALAVLPEAGLLEGEVAFAPVEDAAAEDKDR